MFSEIFIRRPRFAVVISLFLMLAGVICVFRLPVAEYPEVAPPTVVVMAAYPGAGAQTIADTIAAPLEAEVNGIEGLIYYSSTSDNSGNYNLTLTFRADVDRDMALVNVNNAVKRAERKLPSEVVQNGIVVYKRTSDILAILCFNSTNPEHTPLFLSNYIAINIRDSLARIEGVGQAVIFGEKSYSMRIWLDPIKMRALEIGPSEVSAAIRTQNVQAATGAVGAEGASDAMQFKLETQGRLKEAAEFENIVIRSGENGRQVRLADIARVELGSETYAGTGTLNGRPSITLAIMKQSEGNAMQIIDDTTKELKELAKNFPEGMEWDFAYDTTQFVRAAMKEIIETLVLTFVLVVLITYVFLQDWRATLVPAVAIPVSLLGTFTFLYVLGMSINTLTLFALILVIGSVVDDAICVVECCMRLIQEEKLSPTDAAIRTMRELTGALIATTLVVVAIYAPIGFYGGMVGVIYQQFAVTMCIALVLSSIVALTLSPAMCAIFLRDGGEPNRFFKAFNRGLDLTRGGYMGISGFLGRRVLVTVLLLAAILYGNYALFGKLPSAFLPAEDKGNLFCEVVLPPGAAISRTEEVLKDYSEMVQKIDGVEIVITVPGRSMTAGLGENMGMMIVVLDDWSKRKTVETSIMGIMRQAIGIGNSLSEARVNVFTPPAIMGLGVTGGVSFALQATGDQSSQDLSQAANLLLGKIMETGKALYAMNSFDTNTPMLNLKIDRAKAEAMDVPVSSVFDTLQGQLGSSYVNDINLYGKTYKVKFQSDAEFRDNVNTVGAMTVPSRQGDLVPVDALATIDWVVGPRQVERFNMFPSANIRSQGSGSVSSGELMDTIEAVVGKELSNDYKIAWTDMSFQERQNEGQIVWLVFLAILCAYLFLVAQYESWMVPVSVMLSVTTATLGGMIALWLSGMAMDIYCQLGLLMLVGLTAKTSILMVEYSKQIREEGKSIYDSAMEGMKVRFRAVMMTALSFVIGVSPMVVASGAGAGSRISIGVTTFFGMIAATIAGILLIPGLYVITQSMAEASFRLGSKERQPTAPEPKTPIAKA